MNRYNTPNRLKVPNFDSNNNLINYTITKREVIVNGITKVFKRVITPNDVKPFFELFLPEKNVLGITSVLLKDGRVNGRDEKNGWMPLHYAVNANDVDMVEFWYIWEQMLTVQTLKVKLLR